MGNFSNEKNWATAQRLRYVEACLWWRGWIGRKELLELFGISAAVASADLQRYLELNPGAMVYHTSRKRYEVGAGMRCVLHEPSFEEGLALVLGAEAGDGVALGLGGVRHGVGVRDGVDSAGFDSASSVAVLRLPLRLPGLEVASALLRAVAAGQAVEVLYHSVNSGSSRWRVLLPRGFGHDGRRWHLRGFCFEARAWRDFVLGRMEQVRGEGEGEGSELPLGEDSQVEIPRDRDWEEFEELKLQLNSALSAAQKRAWMLDYGMEGEELCVRVRRAMKRYLLAELFLLYEGQEALVPPFNPNYAFRLEKKR